MHLKILSIAIERLLLMLLVRRDDCQKQTNDQNKERDFFIKFHINFDILNHLIKVMHFLITRTSIGVNP